MFLGVSLAEIIAGVFENVGLAFTAFLTGLINNLLTPLFAALGVTYPPAE